MPPAARILAQENPANYGTMLMLILIAVTFCSSTIFVAVAVFLRCVCQRRWPGGVNPSAAGSTQRRWFRSARGLSPSAVSSLPTFAYEKGADGGGGCAVCLESVSDGETVRRLPMCKHLFHVECIDMWLYSHSTCPVCRSVVGPADASMDHQEEPTAAAAVAVVAVGSAVVHLPV